MKKVGNDQQNYRDSEPRQVRPVHLDFQQNDRSPEMPPKTIHDKRKRGCFSSVLSWIGGFVLIIFGLIFLRACVFSPANHLPERNITEEIKNEKFTEENTLPQAKNSKEQTEKATTKKSVPMKTDPVVGTKRSFKDLKVGEIAKKDEQYIGLQYVKKMNYLPLAMGKEDVPEGYEVVIGFFEFTNSGDQIISVDPSKITCYADGKQVSPVESSIVVIVDGVRYFYNKQLDPGCQLLSCSDFEVPVGWKEVKFFYGDDCVWTVSSADVSEENYEYHRLLKPEREQKETQIGDEIYRDKYSVLYEGYEFYRQTVFDKNELYVIFKFNISNKSNDSLDTSSMGHGMRAYQDNVLLGKADFTLDEKFSGFTNLFSIKSIAPGMTSDIYLAFEVRDIDASLHMVYDDGFIFDHYCGEVFIK